MGSIRSALKAMPWRERRDAIHQLAQEEVGRHAPGTISYSQALDRVLVRYPEGGELASAHDSDGFGEGGPPQAVEPFKAGGAHQAKIEGEDVDIAVKAYRKQHEGMSYSAAMAIVLAEDSTLRKDYQALAAPPSR